MSEYDIERIEDEDTGIVGILRYDEYSSNDNPRDWDNCWTILTNQRHYQDIDDTLDPEYLGYYYCEVCDGDGENVNVIDGIEFTTECKACDGGGTIDHTVESWVREHYDAHLIVPVYKYEHGQVQYKAGEANPFSCPWDSGQVGIAVISKAKIEEEWGTEPRRDREFDPETKTYTEVGEPLSPEDWAVKYLHGELETYTQWCNGEIYAYTVESADGEILDSVGGYYGQDDAMGEMRVSFDGEVEEVHKARAEAIAEANKVGWTR